MRNNNNYAFGVLGPYGVGKTHALAELAPALENSGHMTRLVINDITNSSVDRLTLGKLRDSAEMLTGGCVGCGDVGSFTDAIAEAFLEGYSVVVEAPATLHAAEIRQALESVYGNSVAFLTMWNAIAHARNLNYGPAASTIAVANLVGLTNSELVTEQEIKTIIKDLGKLSLQGSSLIELPQAGYGKVVIEALKTSTLNSAAGQPAHDHEHDHNCDHDSCDHSHSNEPLPSLEGIQATWLSSIDTTHGIKIMYDQEHDPETYIDELLNEPSVLRSKGVLYSNRLLTLQYTPEFNNVEALDETQPQGVVIYGTDASRLVEIAQRFAVKNSLLVPVDDIKSSLRSMTYTGEVRDLILEKLELLAQQEIEVEGQLLTDYSEADMGYHIAKQVEGVPLELKVVAFEKYVLKRLEATSLLGEYINDPKHPWYCLRLGTVLAFHDQEARAHLISDELVNKIRLAGSFDMLLHGMQLTPSTDFTYDAKRRVAEENPELLASMLRYGIEIGLVDIAEAHSSFSIMKARYVDSPRCSGELRDWWNQISL